MGESLGDRQFISPNSPGLPRSRAGPWRRLIPPRIPAASRSPVPDMRKARRPRSAGPCELPHPASRARRTGDGVHEKARRLMSAGQFFEFDWLSVLFRQVRNLLEKMGLGSSPRSLSPITGIWRPASPVECCWLSVSRRCAGLHERLHSVPVPQRNRLTVQAPSTYRVRLLGPASARLASERLLNLAWDAL